MYKLPKQLEAPSNMEDIQGEYEDEDALEAKKPANMKVKRNQKELKGKEKEPTHWSSHTGHGASN